MLSAVLLLVGRVPLVRRTSAACGIGVSGTMIITTLLTTFVALSARGRFRAPLLIALCRFALLDSRSSPPF